MEKKQNVPALRFPGFSGEWDMKYFKKLVVLERGGSPRPIDDYITTDDNGLNWVKIGDAPANGSYITHTAEKIKPEGLSKTRQVFPGDLILSNSMSFGKPYIMGIPGCIHDGWLLIRDEKHHFDLKYLCVLLGIPAMLRQYRALAAGSTVSNLNKELVGNTHVYIPDIVEQKKIGSFFDKLDQSIYWCENKIQKLQQFRQAMLTKLFPREGAAEPELRFRGFSGKWKSQKMKDLGSFLKGKLYSKKNIQTSGVPLILYGRLYTQYELVIDEVDTFAVPYENSVWSIGGEVIVPASGETAEDIAIASVVKRKGILLGGDLNIIRPNDTVSSVFLALSISYGHIHNELAKRAQGKSIVHIHNSDLVQLDIRLPSIEEQKAIGDFFYQLDRYISLQQKKLERMQRLKAALLEKLFV